MGTKSTHTQLGIAVEQGRVQDFILNPGFYTPLMSRMRGGKKACHQGRNCTFAEGYARSVLSPPSCNLLLKLTKTLPHRKRYASQLGMKKVTKMRPSSPIIPYHKKQTFITPPLTPDGHIAPILSRFFLLSTNYAYFCI